MMNEQNVEPIELEEIDQVADSYITKDISQILESFDIERNRHSLSESDNKYQFLFYNLRDAVFMYKIKENLVPSKFIVVNEAATYLLGCTKEELLEMSISDLYDEKNIIKTKKIVLTEFNKGKYVFEIEQINKYGSAQHVVINSHKFELGNEKFIVSIVRNYKERTIDGNKQDELFNERSLLLEIITHDLRNHCMVAFSHVDCYFSFKDSSNEERLEFLKNTKSAINRIGSLLDNFATKMRREANTQTQLSPVNILEAIVNTEAVLKDLYPRKEIIIDLNNITENNYVLADLLFEQLLLNLFANLVINTPGDSIKIEINYLSLEEGKCFLSIIGNGKGIHPEVRKSISDRLEKKTIDKSQSEFGMQKVKTLVDRYKGRILIEHRDKDDYSKGTVFKIGLFTT